MQQITTTTRAKNSSKIRNMDKFTISVERLDDHLRIASDLWRAVLNAGSPRDRVNHLRAHVAAISEYLAEVERQMEAAAKKR